MNFNTTNYALFYKNNLIRRRVRILLVPIMKKRVAITFLILWWKWDLKGHFEWRSLATRNFCQKLLLPRTYLYRNIFI